MIEAGFSENVFVFERLFYLARVHFCEVAHWARNELGVVVGTESHVARSADAPGTVALVGSTRDSCALRMLNPAVARHGAEHVVVEAVLVHSVQDSVHSLATLAHGA